MHRIDGPGAAPGNLFTEGNPATALPATTVTDAWLNDVQEELMSILAAAGVAPIKGDQNQVLEALTALFGLNVITPPQFDNDTSIATTAFVQRALGNESGVVIVAANRTMTAADAGRYLFNNANSLVYTLPDPATLALGTKFRIAQGNLTSGGSINAPGSVTIGNITAGGTVSSVAMAQSTEYVLTVVSSTAYQVTVIGGQSPAYTSPQQTITLAGLTTLTHGLPSAPRWHELRLVCVTADQGYSPGDEVIQNPGLSSVNGSTGFSIVTNATQLLVRVSSAAPLLINKTSGAAAPITIANWRFVLRAFA
jgi:hypothetical protein